MFFVDPALAASIGLELYEHRDVVLKRRKRWANRLRHGHLKVVVFGPGGTGKTTLGHALSGASPFDLPSHYDESLKMRPFSVKGDLVCSLIVPPGQCRRMYTWDTLYQMLARGQTLGVINVVSWGYHSFADYSYTYLPHYQHGMAPEQFMVPYLTDRRQVEIDVLNELRPRLIDAAGSIWMITLITKQDLWWDRKDVVAAHYEQGDYQTIITDILQTRGQQRFVHEYASASLVISNMVTSQNEVLAQNVQGYDQNIQRAQREHFFHMFDTLIRR